MLPTLGYKPHFWLGVHFAHFGSRTDKPLFISRNALERLPKRQPWKRALGPWCLDSGGFTELDTFGKWTINAREYVTAIRCYSERLGSLVWCAPQDWMCEPRMLAKTGLTIKEHQRRTLDNYLELRSLAPDVYFVPVLQGWKESDYFEHIEQYLDAGIDLRQYPLVGIGSVCRRQHSDEIATIFERLASYGLRCHGFGVKMTGLEKAARFMVSADSLSWSFQARKRQIQLPQCKGLHIGDCRNCLTYALQWQREVIRRIEIVACNGLPTAPANYYN